MADAKKSDSEFMTVICGLPHGIKLEISYAVPDPRSDIKQRPNRFAGNVYEIPGTNHVGRQNGLEIHRVGKTPYGVSGAQVPTEFWNEWYDAHKDTPFITQGQVMAFPTRAEAKDEAEQRSGNVSGIEQMDRKDMPKDKDGKPTVEKAD